MRKLKQVQQNEVTCPKLYRKFTGSVTLAHDFVSTGAQKLALNFQGNCDSDIIDNESVYNKGKY